MALIKSLETPTGGMATYWRIVQINKNYDGMDMAIDVAGYKDEAARLANKSPALSVRFNFNPSDHPIEELDADAPNSNLLEYWRNFDQHLTYLHIKAICVFAQARLLTLKENEFLTANETASLNFVDAQDKI